MKNTRTLNNGVHAFQDNALWGQVSPHVVLGKSLLQALHTTDRSGFVPSTFLDHIYTDESFRFHSTVMFSLTIISHLLKAAQPMPSDKTLVMFAGTGYSAALLAQVTSQVVAFESDSTLFSRLLECERSVCNLHVKSSRDAALRYGLYNVIVHDGGAVHRVPDCCLDALAPMGRLVAVEYDLIVYDVLMQDPLCHLVRYTKDNSAHIKRETLLEIHAPVNLRDDFSQDLFQF
jgi:protein-L-isoaspartate(D-aspartate) O-methyltransferase